jgi:mRNA interferase MazF
MGRFIKGDIVVVPFPFSDLSGAQKRPAWVLANLRGDDLILCQITSQNIKISK